MIINDLIKDEPHSVKWIKDEFAKGNLFVDDSFQRRYVWLNKHQISLIETILIGYVVPEIFIWETGTDPNTGETKFSIVDGQQRIGAIVDFINGKYKLQKAYLVNKNADYAGKTFSELSPGDKTKIWNYSLLFRRILSDVKREDIVNLFLRLNSTDKSLNPQELRNAEFNGEFLKLSLEIANLDFWKKHCIFSSEDLRRMVDVEFVSSLLIFLRLGIESEITQSSINKAYDLFNVEYEEAESDKKTIMMILENIEKIIERDKRNIFENYIRRTAHFYTIFVSIYKYIAKDGFLSEKMIDNLLYFYWNYEQSVSAEAESYRYLLQGGTRSRVNRVERSRILCEAIEGNISL